MRNHRELTDRSLYDPDGDGILYPRKFVLKEFAAIAVGGVVGALARYGGELLLKSASHGFPWATFAENISGSFLLGFMVAVLPRRIPYPLFKPFLIVGVLGSYTTFSTFGVGFWSLFDTGEHHLAFKYLVSTLFLGVFAVFLGHLCGSIKKPEGS
ncbi:MAG: CrcB family protein [Xenococcaceae cyanobacterium]